MLPGQPSTLVTADSINPTDKEKTRVVGVVSGEGTGEWVSGWVG